MEQKKDKKLCKGLYFNESDKDFIKMRIGINKKQLATWLKPQLGNPDEWINVDVKKARNGKLYGEINTFNPKLDSQDKKNIDDIETIFNDDTPPF
tara:strand:- start:80 stop:364 length:285 start_codon:yes stop_codon:yes gene_type:complete